MSVRAYDLLIRARGETRDADRAMRQLKRQVKDFGRSTRNLGLGLSAAVTAPVVAMGAIGIRELSDMQKANAQTNAVIKSTGGIANVTSGHVNKLSERLLALSGVDDQVIQSGQNLLLTFTNIRNGASKNSKIFSMATRAALDMSIALGTDMQSAAMQIGKALQDPTKGISRLTRVGVVFTEQQKEQVKALAESGNRMGAQKVILAELNKEFGGSAKAYGKTAAGAVGRLKEQFAGLSAELVSNMLPAFTTLSGYAQKAMNWFSGLSDATKKWVGVGLLAGAALGPILVVVGSLISAGSALIPILVGISLPALAVVGAIAAIGAALVIAYARSETFRNVVNKALRGALNSAKQIFGDLRKTFAVWGQWVQAFWKRWGSTIMSIVRPLLRAYTTFFRTWFQNVRDVFRVFLAVIRGDWSGAWNLLKGILSRSFNAMKSIVRSAGSALVAYVKGYGKALLAIGGYLLDVGKDLGKAIVKGIIDAIKSAGGAIKDAVKNAAKGALNNAIDAVVPGGKSLSGGKGVSIDGADWSGITARSSRSMSKGAAPVAGGGVVVNVYPQSQDVEAIAQRVAFILGSGGMGAA